MSAMTSLNGVIVKDLAPMYSIFIRLQWDGNICVGCDSQ